MNITITGFKLISVSILSSVVLVVSKIVPVAQRKMDNSILKEVSKLLQRLSEAERRAKLLKGEITDIRTEIAVLTQSANSILIANETSSVVLRNNHQLASSHANIPGTSKRLLDESDSVNLNPSKRTANVPLVDGYVVVYTDGACERNGKPNAKAGIGVWFGDGNPMNISKPVIGRATNNTAEIQAPFEALKAIQSLGYSKATIMTDSQFTINCMTKWIHRWKKNKWKLADGGPVKNKEDLVKLDNLCRQFQHVKWEYCAGHQGIKGNEEADKLAREGALRYTQRVIIE